MELGCMGFRRAVYWHELRDRETIRARDFFEAFTNCRRDDETGKLTINWVKTKVRLDGEYRFTLSLSRKDAAALFAAAFKDATLEECVEAIQRARAS